jgi:Uma2 family endonuclease
LISVAEYLASNFEPDCDYVDDHIEERKVGEWSHSSLQLQVGSFLLTQYASQGIRVATETRVQVKANRLRVPDICVVIGHPGEEVLTKPPFICIEILSPEDRISRLEARIKDYLDMGVPYVWVLDPHTKQVYAATKAEGLREVKSGVLRTENPAIEMPLAAIFG